MSITGRIHSEESFSTLDGPGVRYVVFLQGCPLRCKYCHNVDSWNVSGGVECLADELTERILRCKNFIEGVTLSGGEPLLQPEFCTEVIRVCKAEKLHTALDTSGAVPLSKCSMAVDNADLILLDIKSSSSEICRRLTGIGNENAIELLNRCEVQGKSVWIRHVVLKGYTLNEKQLSDLGKLLSEYSCVEQINLLPFHKMGEYKWKQNCKEYELYSTPSPTKAEMEWARSIVGKYDQRVI